ncbi:Arca-like protein [Lasiodiplodia theobromae]|uniref:Arca-like protein n=1 Tax=Lasiodiplodia theobromae TaxID=45133 RepID=UPI0015C3475D|nr:Arca-like protein [Lasiodiplodia theobromae]KAF4543846.1 Arca-like protein [Lasiodiplodia theobromae]
MTDHDDGRHQARRGHILDTRILLLYAQNQQDHQPISVTDSSLRAVSLLVTLRQDIFISFLTRTPPPPSPLADDHHYHHHHLLPGIASSSYDRRQSNSNDVENRRLHEASETNNNGQHPVVVDDDYTHAAHVITLTADVLTACHGSGRMSIETWRRLHARLAAWERAKPPSFRPVRYERAATASSLTSATTTPSSSVGGGGVGEGGGGGGVACNGCGGGGGGGKGEGQQQQQPPRFFPRIWFANDCHIGAQLYSDVCRILLLVHDPSLPTLGLDRAKATQRVDGKVRGYVRRMCGVAVSHPNCQPAASVTGMVIAMCGDRFTDREEQEELLRIIEKSEAHLTWPYLKAGEQLRTYWGR